MGYNGMTIPCCVSLANLQDISSSKILRCCIGRCLFREHTYHTLFRGSVREAFSNSRDEIKNFFLSVSCFETRSRISACQSHASRRDREFLPFSLMLRDEIENFCLSVSCFETRSRSSWEFLEILPDETVVFA